MTVNSDQDRQPPRERFAGPEHAFDLRELADGLRDETTLARDGHRQMTIFHKLHLTLIVFDFEAGGRLADHQAEAHVAIQSLSGVLEVSTPNGTHRLPAGSVLVLDPGVMHDVAAPGPAQMLLTVHRVQ